MLDDKWIIVRRLFTYLQAVHSPVGKTEQLLETLPRNVCFKVWER